MIKLDKAQEALVYATLMRIAHGVISNTLHCDMSLKDREGLNIILTIERNGPEFYRWPDRRGRYLTEAAHKWMRNYEAKALNQKV